MGPPAQRGQQHLSPESLRARRRHNLEAGGKLGVCHNKLDALRKQAQASRRPGIHLVGIIPTSSGSRKKLVAVFSDRRQGRRRIVSQSFGYRGMEDFTTHGDVDRRERYWNRHRKDLDTADPVRAGFLSWFILWNRPTLDGSERDYRRRLAHYNRHGTFPVAHRWR